MKIGIIDILSQKDEGWYSRYITHGLNSIMPQAIACWLEPLGHKIWYNIHAGYEDLIFKLNTDLDVVFISSFTASAYLAYAMANYYRSKGVITILGGPHARAYTEESLTYFNYVIGLADKKLIVDLIQDISVENGIYLTAKEQPTELVPLAERWKYLEYAHSRGIKQAHYSIPMVGSTGCPYSCGFCVDAKYPYKLMDFSQLKEDLKFLQTKPGRKIVLWYDPNFGIKFDQYMGLIEDSVKPDSITFVAEPSLSTLTEERAKILHSKGFRGIAPGIESWSDFSHKQKGKSSKLDKVKEVAEHLNMLLPYLPLIQANLIFGLDSDEGEEPFELTKKFIDLVPGVYANFQTFMMFGNSAPMWKKFSEEKRILNKVPYNLLDGFSVSNIIFKNYDPSTFYKYYADLISYTCSFSSQVKLLTSSIPKAIKLFNVARRCSGRGSVKYYRDLSSKLTTPEYKDFYTGKTNVMPVLYIEQIKKDLGALYPYLQEKTNEIY